MKKLVFIDATMRAESRTRRIAAPLVSELGKRYDIETISLDGAGFPAVGSRILHDRDCGIVPEEYAAMSRRIAAADRIVIAAPFWDMSFPSALKVFFENMSLFHITFDSDDTRCYGLCKCSKVLYITTRGMSEYPRPGSVPVIVQYYKGCDYARNPSGKRKQQNNQE